MFSVTMQPRSLFWVLRLQLGTVQALQDTGCVDLNAADARGATALLHAARRHNVAAMRLLLAAGAGGRWGHV